MTPSTLLLGRRSAPLTAAEAAAVRSLAPTRLPGVAALALAAVDGAGEARVVLRAEVPAGRGLRSAQRALLGLAERVGAAVPGLRWAATDPLGLFGGPSERPGPCTPGSDPLPTITEAPSERAFLPARPPVRAAPPRTDGALVDLAQVLERQPDDTLAARGIGAAAAQGPRVAAWVEQGVLVAGFAHLLAAAAAAGAPLPGDPRRLDAARLGADARERAALDALLGDAGALDAEPDDDADDGALEAIRGLGLAVLARPELAEAPGSPGDPVADGTPAGDDSAEDDGDLLLDDDLVLDDDAGAAEADSPPLARALSGWADWPAAASLRAAPPSAAALLRALAADEAGLAGALLLIGAGWVPAPPGLDARLPGAEAGHALRALGLWAAAGAARPSAAVHLLAALDGADPAIAAEALLLLGRVGGPVGAWRTRLDGPLAPVAAAAATAAGDAVAIGFLPEAPPSPAAARATARLLGALGEAADLPRLAPLLDHDAASVRVAAARALGALGPASTLDGRLSTDDPDTCVALLRGLAEARRGELLAVVERATRHGKAAVREAAATALGELGLPAATPALVVLFQDKNPAVRKAALAAAARVGDRRAVHPLRRLATQKDAIGAAARDALASGVCLRLDPPDGRVRLRARADTAPLPGSAAAFVRALDAVGLRAAWAGELWEATLTADPQDTAPLGALARALERADEAWPGLAWSVRDGHAALRHSPAGWSVGGPGRICRDAGFFDESLPAVRERPPLSPLAEGTGPGGLPIAVMPFVRGGRVAVVAPVDPSRPAADPQEITGEVPIRPSPPDDADRPTVLGEAPERPRPSDEPTDPRLR